MVTTFTNTDMKKKTKAVNEFNVDLMMSICLLLNLISHFTYLSYPLAGLKLVKHLLMLMEMYFSLRI